MPTVNSCIALYMELKWLPVFSTNSSVSFCLTLNIKLFFYKGTWPRPFDPVTTAGVTGETW